MVYLDYSFEKCPTIGMGHSSNWFFVQSTPFALASAILERSLCQIDRFDFISEGFSFDESQRGHDNMNDAILNESYLLNGSQ